jgi:uncharacterized protein
MSEETLENLVKEAISYADGFLTFAFQGGEPTLTGLDFYKKAVDFEKKYNDKGLTIENTIQTNGLLIDDEWAEFLHENNFLVGLSLDGPKKLNDGARVDVSGNGTFEGIMDTVNLLRRYNVDFNILTVVTDEISKKASYLYKFYKKNKFPYVQLIPCMDEAGRNDEIHSNPYAVTPFGYGKFLCELFDLWYADFVNGEIMDIRIFSNLAQMAVGYPAEECGMNGFCTCYFAVEGDGSVYPCDFYCMDEWRLGEVSDSFSKLYGSDKAKQFVQSSAHTSDECRHCPYFKLCRGGCRRWREPFSDGKPGLNYLCEGYKIFFEHTLERIMLLGKTIKS